VSVVTAQARLNAVTVASTAPITRASPELATTAQIRRSGPAAWYGGATPAWTACGTRRGGESVGLRGPLGCALAVLRHPASRSASNAKPASQAIRTVRSLIDTQDETLTPVPPPPAGTVRTPSPRHRVWAVPLTVLAMLGLVAVIVAGVVPARAVARKDVPDPDVPGATVEAAANYARTPRTATPVDDRVSFSRLEGLAEVDADRRGDIYFVTISNPTQSALSWWVAGGRSCDVVAACSQEPEIDFYTYDELYPTRSRTQERSISLQMMRTSSQVAQYVALDALGYDVSINPGNVVVADLVCLEEAADGTCTTQAPAAEVLEPGDTLLRIDGRELNTVDDLVAALEGKQPGDVVRLDISRYQAGEQTVDVELTTSPQDPGRAIVGFQPFDTATVDLPFEINIDSARVGGPSAGAAFTLTLIDELSPGDLTGGGDVAVTGTIELDGTIGAIGGLPQKASAVRQAGVGTFLVPASQSEADLARAREIAGDDVDIVPVANLDEALAALEALGGDPLPAPG
jgi:PDZ domain-containing protein